MGSKCHEKNIFESSFDSFEIDDAFLSQIDLDLKKDNVNGKTFVSKEKPKEIEKGKEKKMLEIKVKSYDTPLFIEDLNSSTVSDFDNDKKTSLKAENTLDDEKKDKGIWRDHFISCLSPILGNKSSRSFNLSSSTPERPSSESTGKEEVTGKETSVKNPDYFLESDLFDDWNIDEKENKKKETVTLSQALELIKEAELEKQCVEETLNQSIDLLTGQIVGGDVGVMFEESFDLPNSLKKKEKDKECVSADVKTPKPPAAQKLNFECKKTICEKTESDKDFYFSSDDDLDFCTQNLLKKNNVTNCAKQDLNFTKSFASPLVDSDLNESSDGNIIFSKKKRKSVVIIESDTAEDSPSPIFLRQNKIKPKKRRNLQESFRREYLDLEAEASDADIVVSSDETEEGEYDESFVDEASYFTQNFEANMTGKYLESVKDAYPCGTFKIPAAKPYDPANVFSQIPEESNSDYEIDSFCVKYVEEEEKTDLSDLEIAEKIIEMDRKKKKKKRIQKSSKLN